ncbi:hypothetical protein, partial [Parabacteroides merdae]|uniref:hypothetical protein n=1 Tax=Parabacteroides merdae TaxID=46503 RepID=UPI0034A3B0DA
ATFLSLTLQQFMDIRNDFIDLYNVHDNHKPKPKKTRKAPILTDKGLFKSFCLPPEEVNLNTI